MPDGYVGAMGSRRTHEEHLRLLRDAGVEGQQLAALRSLIGLGLRARTPEETAVSTAAEIIAHANGASGLPLSLRTGPIHRHAAAGTLPAVRPRRPGPLYLRARKYRRVDLRPA